MYFLKSFQIMSLSNYLTGTKEISTGIILLTRKLLYFVFKKEWFFVTKKSGIYHSLAIKNVIEFDLLSTNHKKNIIL